MTPLDPKASFNPDVTTRYDDEVCGDEGAAVAFLKSLANGGPALEFANGTGRIALPLAETGVKLDSIELSEAMFEILRKNSVGENVDVRISDMSTVSMNRTYPLVYLVFNTIFNIQMQDGQIE